MIGFKEFAEHLERAIAECKPQIEIGLAKVGEHTKTMAAEYFGHEMSFWEPLSEATMHGFEHPYGFYIKGKIELGYTGHISATDPLLRTGATERSIEVAVEGLMMVVGSPSKIMRYQELGTHNPLTGDIPPRPVLGPAALASLPYAAEVFGELGVKLFTPGALKL